MILRRWREMNLVAGSYPPRSRKRESVGLGEHARSSSKESADLAAGRVACIVEIISKSSSIFIQSRVLDVCRCLFIHRQHGEFLGIVKV